MLFKKKTKQDNDNNEIKTETPVEEPAQTEEVKPEIDLTHIELTPYIEGEKKYDEIVEEERKNIHKMNKAAEKRSRICILVILAFGVLGVAFLYQPNLQFISWISLGVALAAIIVFSVWNKRIGRPDAHKYIVDASVAIDRFVFDHPHVKDVFTDQKRKYELNEVVENGAFTQINGVTSRNFVDGNYNNHHFLVCEAAYIKSETKTKRKTLYIGKNIVLKNDLHFEGRYVVSILNEKEVDKPNGIDDLELKYEKENLKIYGPSNGDYKKDLNLKFIEKISKIPLNDQLLGINVIVKAGETTILASYDDEVISLPFYKPLNASAIEQFKKELYSFMDAGITLIKE